jgi:hypothetical protein
MTIPLLIIALFAYLALAALFTGAAWKANAKAKWFGLAAIAAAVPVFFWAGAFAEQFSAGQCYTKAINTIADSVGKTDDPATLAERIRALPLYGYETVCSEVEAAANEL